MLYAKKSLGQNFLRSRGAIEKIVSASDIEPNETVLEAGPGEGVLTEALLRAGARVFAVEKDRRLIPLLQKKFSREIQSGSLTLVENDILDFNPSRLTLHATRYKIVANIPYYITGAFVRKFLESENQPSRMTLLLQKEVAERIAARGKKESLLSVSVKAYGRPRYVETVKAGSFWPKPKVDSAILSVENISKKNFAGVSEEKFFAAVKAGFAHKRKKLSGNLKNFYGNVEEALAKSGVDKDGRAEDVPLEKWLLLAAELTPKTNAGLKT